MLTFWICFLFVFLFWFFVPIMFGLTPYWSEFVKIYPNKNKQLIAIFLHGPMIWIYFGWCWFGQHVVKFKRPRIFGKFRDWLHEE